FESGAGAVPSDWDLSNALSSSRKSTAYIPFFDSWYFELGDAVGEEIISDWTYLPANTDIMATFFIADRTNTYPDPATLSYKIERDDYVIVEEWTSNEDWPRNTEFTTGPDVRQYRVRISMDVVGGPPGPYAYGNITFDLVDTRPVRYYGIEKQGSRANTLIKNGNVIQGRGASTYGHAIFSTGGNNFVVDNVYTETIGFEAAGIYSNFGIDTVVLNSEVVTEVGPYVFNRNQLSAALMTTNGQDAIIYNNVVRAGKAWGGIYSSKPNTIIAKNDVETNSVTVNHHGIVVYAAHGSRIFDNIVVADPGQGILLTQTTSSIAYDNDISMIGAQRPDLDHVRYSRDGIRVNDYLGGSGCTNNLVDGNDIYVIADYDEYYLPGFPVEDPTDYGDNIISVGISMPCASSNVTVSNNNIEIVAVDEPGSWGTGIETGSPDTGMLYINNTIESNQFIIAFGGYGGSHIFNTSLVSNTLIKGPNPPTLPEFHTIYGYRGVNITYAELVDTTLLNGAILDPSSMYLTFDVPYEFFVKWYLDLVIENQQGVLENVLVTIRDNLGETIYVGFSDQQGKIPRIALSEKRFHGDEWQIIPDVELRTPHTIQALKDGYLPSVVELEMDASKSHTILMELEGPGTLLYCKLDSDQEVFSPTTHTAQMGSLGEAVVEAGSEITYVSGYNGFATLIDPVAPYTERLVFAEPNFDLLDIDSDGGRIDFWIKFNDDPQSMNANHFIGRTNNLIPDGPIYWYTMEIVPSNYPYFELISTSDNNNTGGRLVVHPNTWEVWENIEAEQWHQFSILWRRNHLDDKAELHLFIDGTKEGCYGCSDYNGNLPPDSSFSELIFGTYAGGGDKLNFTLDELWSFSRWNHGAGAGTYASLSIPEGVTLTFPKNNALLYTDRPVFDFIANNDINNIFSCGLYIDSVLRQTLPVVMDGVLSSFISQEFETGTHTWYVVCDGRLTSETRTFEIDASAGQGCSEGQTIDCITSEDCDGTKTCAGGEWGECIDIPGDGCPEIGGDGGYIFQNGLNGYTGVIDAGIFFQYPDTTRDFTAVRGGTTYRSRGLIKFDLSSLDNSFIIEKANLSLYKQWDSSASDEVKLYQVLKDWIKPGVTWNCVDDTDQNGCDGSEVPWDEDGAIGEGDIDLTSYVGINVDTTTGWYTWDVTD
ncbi:DNRLRE domain-containing protein, partial [Candidatus Aenigmatarchaeota archaeon]